MIDAATALAQAHLIRRSVEEAAQARLQDSRIDTHLQADQTIGDHGGAGRDVLSQSLSPGGQDQEDPRYVRRAGLG